MKSAEPWRAKPHVVMIRTFHNLPLCLINPLFCRDYNFLTEVSGAVGSKAIAEESSFRPSTKDELITAVDTWCSNQENAIDLYSEIYTWDTSLITDMGSLFLDKLTFNGNISNWDMSSVTTMAGMFYRATAFNQPLGDWDVSSVTDMNNMFYIAYTFNQPIGDWDVSSVTTMTQMFTDGYAFNQPLGDWDVSSVTGMNVMFQQATTFNQPLRD